MKQIGLKALQSCDSHTGFASRDFPGLDWNVTTFKTDCPHYADSSTLTFTCLLQRAEKKWFVSLLEVQRLENKQKIFHAKSSDLLQLSIESQHERRGWQRDLIAPTLPQSTHFLTRLGGDC